MPPKTDWHDDDDLIGRARPKDVRPNESPATAGAGRTTAAIGEEGPPDTLASLARRLDQRLDNLERLCFHLRDEKLDSTAVLDLLLEQLRRHRR